MTKDLVTIGIPTYNSAAYLGRCLESIAAQTYRRTEIIVSDNASSDDTVRLARQYAEQHGFLVHVNTSNIGAAGNFNEIIRRARGEYIAIYHADDEYTPTIVEESVAVLSGEPSLGLVGTMGMVIDGEGNIIGDMQLHEDIRALGRSKFTFDDAFLGAVRNLFMTPSIMVRSAAYREVGGFDQARGASACDYEMWLRIARRYPVAVIDKPLMRYRVHGGQGSEQQVRKNIEIPDILWVLKEYRRFITDASVGKVCDRLINKGIFKAAKKQNRSGEFAKSDQTLRLLDDPAYLVPKMLYRVLNAMRYSTRKR